MEDETNLLEDEENDRRIEEFCKNLNKQDYKDIQSAKVIHYNFESLNEILEPLNEAKIFFENPELKITKTIKSKLQIITLNKQLGKEDSNFIKDIKCIQQGYEESAYEANKRIENIKKNFTELSNSVVSLIDAIEKTKAEYFETIVDMINPMKVEVEKIESIDQSKFTKEKKVNYKDMKNKLDEKIKPYDRNLSQIIKDTKDVLNQVNDNIKIYIDLLNSLDEPINTVIEKMQNVFNNFEEKGKEFINIIYNYKSPEEKKKASTIFREIQKLSEEMKKIFDENSEKLKKQDENIKNKKKKCYEDLQNIRTNNMNISEKMKDLHDQEQDIMREINEFLKFLNKPKVKYYQKELKGLQLFQINKKVIDGTESILVANQKIKADLTKLKEFVDEKDNEINKVFSLDLAFIMDITGSMEPYLTFAKEKIITVINKIMEDSTVMVNLGFVGYRDDLNKEDRGGEYVICPELTRDIELVKNLLSLAEVGGGNDICEDMAGGLYYALQYKWKSRSKFAMLIADAPCHGVQYHGLNDDSDFHKGGDPIYKIDELVKDFAAKNINLMCLNIEEITRKLYENFKKYYKSGLKQNSNSEIIVRDFNEDTSKLTDIIVSKAKEFYNKRHETTINENE